MSFFLSGTVAEVEDVTPRIRRIRIAGDSLRDLRWTPGQHVRVRVGTLTLRTYSIWDYAGHLDLCVLDHPGAGPGARWAREVEVGGRVSFTRPDGRFVVRDDAPYHLFVGDATASVAFGAMLRALPTDARVYGVVEAADRLTLPRELTWTDDLLGTLAALDLPDEPGVAYLAGEAKACQAARRHLVQDRGWPRRSAVVKPFWTPGKRGMD
ncbi:siderophore-interacting protein [Actinophytocola oryzae]|uniref:NADPH-dependent ferric siderophore reductase n=1 Tax=Actinophytocola oryzae TaxID=502181 RepID=A0A4R7VCT8_9PSEU|nr:siderophore-interacting protein [Actinophytocola oryzae]TDV46827.1 NADPH-dependent ferric siderophore reductase [Actinophytocola oryzae]